MKTNNLIRLLLVSIFIVGCEEIISVPDISDEMVIIQSPVQGAEIDVPNVQFSWMPVDFAESYQIQVATPSFIEATAIVVDTIVVDSLNTIGSFERDFESQSYEWRIRASNSDFHTDYTISDFTVNSASPFGGQIIEFLTPVNEFVTTDTLINIQWTAIEGALLYSIIVEDINTNEVVTDLETTETNIEIDFMSPGLYSYRVRAETASENTMYSEQTITVE